MAISKNDIRASFPADPKEFDGIDLSKMTEKHRILNRELISSGMDFNKVAEKYEYAKGSLYRIARMPTSRAYRSWLGQAGRNKMIAEASEVLETLTSILRAEAHDEHVTPRGDIVEKKVDNKDILKAAELLAKSYGLLIEKQVEKKEQVIIVDIEGIDGEDDIIDV